MLDTPESSRRPPRLRPARAAVGLVLAAAMALLGALVPGSTFAADADAPPVPVLSWTDCGGGFQCATAAVPLDYAQPHGRTISIALIRLPASDPSHRIGSLFTNPGGPGGSGVQFIRFASSLFPLEVRARFDLIGFDPRGVAASTPVRCFASVAEQQAFFQKLPSFPVGAREERAYIEAFRQFDALCAQRNPDLLPHMSTANADRDMDLLRQAVGDAGLSYLGVSYGTYLGASYVNLFPHRVRAVILDGAIEPVEWATGRDEESETLPFSTRLRSDDGAFKTLGQFLDLCAAGGPQRCAFAAGSDEATHDKFDNLLHRLLKHPLVLPIPGGTVTITYADVVSLVLGALYSPSVWLQLAQVLQSLVQQTGTGGPELLALRQALVTPAPSPYNNSAEAGISVFCADTDNPHDPFAWPRAAREADERAPYFGRPWTFISQACGTWKALDRARYTGPWDQRTSNPVLVVGNRFDPATRYESAVALSRELARGRLLTLDGWGHTSLGKSTCTLQFETAYLLTGALPPAGTVCRPDQVPFAAPAPQQSAAERAVTVLTRPMLPGTPGL